MADDRVDCEIIAIEWREGAAEPPRSRFARLRVRVAQRDYWLADRRPEEWLLIEWPKGETEPIKYWLSTLPHDIAFTGLVDAAKLRWRIERDCQELKQEVGLDISKAAASGAPPPHSISFHQDENVAPDGYRP